VSILKVKRLELALTQRELADAAGVDINTIGDLEKDPPVKRPRPTTVRKLAEALGIAPKVLVELFTQEVTA
jgi:transcriptional regulator with XRE-family HTH domain